MSLPIEDIKERSANTVSKYAKRWLLITGLLLTTALVYVLHAKNAPQVPCVLNPEICQPKTPPPCQPMLCPDVDRR